MSVPLCDPCMWWHARSGPWWCEAKDYPPAGPCPSIVVPIRRIILALPRIREVRP